MIYVGTMIVNGEVFIKNPNKKSIDQAIDEAIKQLEKESDV